MPVLHEHVPLGEVARWEVEVGTVDRHQLGKEQGRDFRLQIVKMVAIHENASFRSVPVNVHIEIEPCIPLLRSVQWHFIFERGKTSWLIRGTQRLLLDWRHLGLANLLERT